MKKPPFLKCCNSQLAPLFALLAMTISAHADNATWNGTTSLWSDVLNWSGPPVAVPGAVDTATFSSTGITGTALAPILASGSVTVKDVIFDATAQNYFVAGVAGTLNLTDGGSIVVNNGNQTFGLLTGGTVASVNAAAGGAVTITGNSGTTTPIGSGPGITTTGGLTLAIDAKGPVSGTTTVTFNGTGVTTTAAIQMASVANTATSQTKIVKNGTGVLVLGAAANDRIWGGFEINGGTVILNQQNALSNRNLTIGGGSTLQMNIGGQTSFNNALGNIVINGDVNFHYNNTGNWGLGQTGVGTANASQFSSTGNYVATFSVATANQNGIRVSANNGGFTGTYKLGQNGALTFNGAARGSSSATLNMGDAGFGSHYFSTGVILQDLTTQTIQPIKFGALTGTDTAAVMSGRQNFDKNTSGTQFEIGGLSTNTAYAGSIRDGSTSALLLQNNGTNAATNQALTATNAAVNYSRANGVAGIQGTTELVKVGSGTLTLTGTNTHSGGTVIKGGTIAVSSDAALGATYDGSLRVFSYIPGTANYTNTATSLPGTTLTGGGGTGASVNLYSSNTAAINNAGSNLFLSFSNQDPNTTPTATAIVNNMTGSGYISVPTVSFSGGILGAGTGPVASVRVQGLLTLDGGTLRTDAAIASNRAIVIGTGGGAISTQGFNSTFSGNINGSGNLNISGGGKVTLSSATNSLTGTTTIGANTTLDISGALSGAVQVDSTGTIKGVGSVGGALTVASGGILAPGNSPGNLTVGSGLTLAGSYAWELGALSAANPGVDFDTITVTGGTVNITDAVIQLNLGSFAPSAVSFWQTDQTWAGIINNTGVGSLTGTFAAIDNSAWSALGAFTTTNTDNDVNLVWTAAAVPEPTTGATLGLAGMLLMLHRRRAERK